MVHSENFVAVVKSNGKILRENQGTVRLPFGSEYSILLKNLDSRKAVVTIEIDGKDVCDNHSLIIHPKTTSQLDGVVKNGEVTNRFKFIQKTEEISDYRGDRIDDGIIRIEVKFEARREEQPIQDHWYWNWPTDVVGTSQSKVTWQSTYYTYSSDGVVSDSRSIQSNYTNDGGIPCSADNDQSVCMDSCGDSMVPKEDEGITVKGSETHQKLRDGYINTVESQSTVITLKLKGTSNNQKISKPIFVKSKVKCSTCGRVSKSKASYCENCGTKL